MKRNSKQCLHGAIVKRRKEPRVTLCNLPTDVLSHILSQLPINDAVRTSVLSRKWKYIWHHHTNLAFNFSTMRKHYFNTGTGYGSLSKVDFITRVDAVLHQRCGTGVEQLEIKFGLQRKHAEHIDRWVNFAVAAKAKKLAIDLLGGSKFKLPKQLLCDMYIPREEPYNIPSKLFDADFGSHLQYLELTCVALQLPADFKGFLNLKNLSLVYVSVTDEDVHSMLSRCKFLEFFDISYCATVTSIRISHPMSHLKHLVVCNCPSLLVIELNCSPVTLGYTGSMVPLKFSSTSRLMNVRIELLSNLAAIYYIVTGFPATLPRLETLTLQCSAHHERTSILPERPLILAYLRHLRLELVLSVNEMGIRETDVLDYAYLLEVAPFMETLELHMWMDCCHQPYCKEDGELRVRLPQQHKHLKFVRISGFFGHKDQVELALHILHSSVVLERMEITPRIEIAQCDSYYERTEYVDGGRVATEFICKADHRNVVNVMKVPFQGVPPLVEEVGCDIQDGGGGPR